MTPAKPRHPGGAFKPENGLINKQNCAKLDSANVAISKAVRRIVETRPTRAPQNVNAAMSDLLWTYEQLTKAIRRYRDTVVDE